MKIYRITFNEYSYDQYDSFIIIAETGHKAVQLLKNTYRGYGYGAVDWSGGYKIREINPLKLKRTAILLSSFHAG